MSRIIKKQESAVTSLSDTTVTGATVASGDSVLFKDADDSGNLKVDSAKDIANLADALDAGVITSGELSHERGGLEADVSAYDGYALISGGSTSNIKMNFSASAAPDANDDSGSGYAVGSLWIDTSADKAYQCLDATSANAVWTEITQGGASEITSASSSNPTTMDYFEDTDNGTNKVSVKAPDSLGADVDFILPNSLPNSPKIATIDSNGTIADTIATTTSAPGFGLRYMPVLESNSSFDSTVKVNPTAFTNPCVASILGRHYPNIGVRGIDTAVAGITATNDRLYLFPIRCHGTKINRISFGVETADASGTADVDVVLYLPYYDNTAGSNVAASKVINSDPEETNISTTGIKTLTTPSDVIQDSGVLWVGIRPHNIGTSLVFANVDSTYPQETERFFGQDLSNLGSPSAAYGVYFDNQTSLDTSLTTDDFDGFVSTPIAIYIGTE